MKLNSKFVGAVAVFLILGSSKLALAVEPGKAGPDFEKKKKEILSDMDERISALQSFRSCVSGASDHDSMKHCREDLEKREKEVRARDLNRRAQEIDENIKRLQEEKAKLNGQSGGAPGAPSNGQ